MNHLNSVLIEGTVLGKIKNELADGKPGAAFTIISSRLYKDQQDNLCEEKMFIDIEAQEKLAEHFTVSEREGKGVRVVGKIKCYAPTGDTPARFVVSAEHIEFRPQEAY